MLPQSLLKMFPGLPSGKAEKTSDRTGQYNCIAWAAQRDESHWWEPIDPKKREPWDYWPDGDVPLNYDFETFILLFEHAGFEKCPDDDDGRLEIIYEKIAVYSNDGEFTHVAAQLCSGAWTSKLGPEEDVRHYNLGCLEGGDQYGGIRRFMRKRCSASGRCARIVFKIFPFLRFFASPKA
jgi:hypothetical protein